MVVERIVSVMQDINDKNVDNMDLSFDIRLTTSELYTFSMRHTYFGMSGIFGLIISFGSLAVVALRYKYLDKSAIVALIIIGLLFTVVQPVMLYFKAGTQVKRNESIKGCLHYVFSEEGIIVTQGEQQAEVKWYEVRKRVVTGSAMYLYMSPVRAFIFPKSQCMDKFDELVNFTVDMMNRRGTPDVKEDDTRSATQGDEANE